MRRRRMLLLLLMVWNCLFMTIGCTEKGADDRKEMDSRQESEDKKGAYTMDKKFLSEQELIDLADLAPEDYSGVDLGQFIEDYELTEDNVENFRIKLLLSEYRDILDTVNMEYLFTEERDLRKGDFTEHVVYVAFYENKGTSVQSVLYDCMNLKRYMSRDSYLFTDVKGARTTDCMPKDIDNLLAGMEEIGVFQWERMSEEKEDILADIQSMALVVTYTDGSAFRLHRSGSLRELGGDSYLVFRRLLLPEEE